MSHATRSFLNIGELSDGSIRGLMSSGFELINFDYGLYQGIDHKGRPETNVRIEGIHITYDGLPSREIIYWAMSSSKYYSGALLMYDAHGMPLEKVYFEDGACIGMEINYVSEGSSSAFTKLTISPRVLKVGDKTITQPWTIKNVSGSYHPPIKAITDKLEQPIGKTDLWLVVDKKEYELDSFYMSFHQNKDHKGQPVEDVQGGQMFFSVPQLPDDLLRKWAMGEETKMEGEFQFRRGDQNTALRIEFVDAFCVNMKPHQTRTGEMATSFHITANDISLNGKSLFNGWLNM